MDREIKFRIWDKIYNKMREVKAINWWFDEGDIQSIEYIDEDHVDRRHDKDDVILMQYTGLKDKNGKEIYEGDIIKRTLDDECGIVGFERGTFVISDKVGDLYGFLRSWYTTVEVIGNIHENPELLE